MLDKFKKDKYLWGVLAIMLLAIFVRGWMFSDLLTFKMDQSRDVKLVEDAYKAGNGTITLEGLGELPLLGPRAAKTYLRLGPISYYFEYVSLLIFGDKPWAMAMPDFIFSILTIPLFYYFLRQAFNRKISLITTMLFASSFFLTQYGRFAWNPNSIPFWSLIYFLGLYKVAKCQMPSVKCHKGGKWLLVMMVGYGVASQLHFTAALAYPSIGGLFVFGSLFLQGQKSNVKSRMSILNILISNFKFQISNLNWRYWLVAAGILGVMYLPMVLSEVCTQGDNWVQFKYALSGRGKEEFTLHAKGIQSLKLHSEYFWFTLTSVNGGSGTLGVVGFAGMAGGLFAIFARGMLFRNQNTNSQKLNIRRQTSKNLFFLLIWIWFGVMFLLYTKLAFNVLKPRYWLLEAPIFFAWLALILGWLDRYKNIIKKSCYFLVGILVIINLYAVGNWYWTLQHQEDSRLLLWDLKLKDENRIPWGQLQKSADYIETLSGQTEKDICFYATGEYRPVYDYIFEHRGLGKKIRRMSFKSDSNNNCLFVAIDHHRHREIPRIPKDHKDEFEKVGKKEVGFVTIWRVSRKSKVESQKLKIKESNKQEIENEEQGVTDKEQQVLNNKYEENTESNQGVSGNLGNSTKSEGGVSSSNENNESKELNMPKADQKKARKPKRVERVRWKDVFKCDNLFRPLTE